MKMAFLYGVMLTTLLGYSVKPQMGDDTRHPAFFLFPSLFASHVESGVDNVADLSDVLSSDDTLRETPLRTYLKTPRQTKRESETGSMLGDDIGRQKRSLASSLLWSAPLIPSAQAEPSPVSLPLTNASSASSAAIGSNDFHRKTEENGLGHLPTQEILYCNGEANNAHFRESPTLVATSILGAIKRGDWVYLTGKQMQADGVRWHEAIAPTLYPTVNKGAQNHLAPNQTGWIASCFVH